VEGATSVLLRQRIVPTHSQLTASEGNSHRELTDGDVQLCFVQALWAVCAGLYGIPLDKEGVDGLLSLDDMGRLVALHLLREFGTQASTEALRAALDAGIGRFSPKAWAESPAYGEVEKIKHRMQVEQDNLSVSSADDEVLKRAAEEAYLRVVEGYLHYGTDCFEVAAATVPGKGNIGVGSKLLCLVGPRGLSIVDSASKAQRANMEVITTGTEESPHATTDGSRVCLVGSKSQGNLLEVRTHGVKQAKQLHRALEEWAILLPIVAGHAFSLGPVKTFQSNGTLTI